MKKYILCLWLLLTAFMAWADNGLSDKEIRYTTSDGNPIDFNSNSYWTVKPVTNARPTGKDYYVAAFEEDVTSIVDYAFTNNANLTSITIPASVTVIGKNAFNQCKNLKSVTFASGSKLTTIGESAFQADYSLTSITIPSGVTDIYDNAFNGCGSLGSVTVQSEYPPKLGYGVWTDIPSSPNKAVLFVPSGSESYYKSYPDWKQWFTINEAVFTLKVSDVKWASLYYDKTLDIPDGMKVYYASSVSGNLVTLNEIKERIPAMTAVIVNADKGTYKLPFATEDAVPLTVGENLFKGLLSDAALTDIQTQEGKTIYVLDDAQDGLPVFNIAKPDNIPTLAAFRMYLPLSTDGNIKFRISDESNPADAIEAVPLRRTSGKAVSMDGLIYDENTYNRPFIRDGKLFMNIRK